MCSVYTVTDRVLGCAPSVVMARYVIETLGLAGDPTVGEDWPLYIGSMPDYGAPNDCMAIYDTTPVGHGRNMDGTYDQHFGMQLRVRSKEYDDGWDKINAVAEAVDLTYNDQVLMADGNKYTIRTMTRASSVLPLGIEPQTKRRRYLFTVNWIALIEPAVSISLDDYGWGNYGDGLYEGTMESNELYGAGGYGFGLYGEEPIESKFYGGPAMIEVEDLASGVSIVDRPVFSALDDITMSSISILTQGIPVGIDDADKVIITIKNSSGSTVVTKTFDLQHQPPTNGLMDLGSLSNVDLDVDEFLTLSVSQTGTADMPAFLVIVGGVLR